MWPNSPSHTPAPHRLHLWSGQVHVFFPSGLCEFAMLQTNTFRWGSVSLWIFGDKGGRTLSPLERSGAMLKLRQNYLGEMWHHKGLTKIEESGISLSPKSQRLDLTFELWPPSVNWPHLLKSLPHHFLPISPVTSDLCSKNSSMFKPKARRAESQEAELAWVGVSAFFSFFLFFCSNEDRWLTAYRQFNIWNVFRGLRWHRGVLFDFFAFTV